MHWIDSVLMQPSTTNASYCSMKMLIFHLAAKNEFDTLKDKSEKRHCGMVLAATSDV